MSDLQPPARTLLQQLASLQSDIQRLKATQTAESASIPKKDVWRKRGRALKRLVSLTDNVMDMLLEGGRRSQDMAEAPDEEEDWLYKCYEELLKRIPGLQQEVDTAPDAAVVNSILKYLNEGGDAARSDDACRLKTNIVAWLTNSSPSNIPLSAHDKLGRGFSNDATGRLLCPVEYDWNSAEHRDRIRAWHPKFVVTANLWPAFLYEECKYDPTDPVRGLFKGEILLKAFKLIFTSPTSVDHEGTDSGKRRRGERRTRDHVAQLLKMNKVTPRAIAYTAVQVRFALSDCGSWRLQDTHFDYSAFYRVIVKWFEVTCGEEQEFVDELLLWWNRQVFGRHAVLTYHPQAAENASVAASFKRRRTNNVPVSAGPSNTPA